MSEEQKPSDVGPKGAEATNDLRRKLLKAGAAAVPAIVSLQSGTAWALSSCASRIDRPSVSDINSYFGSFRSGPPNSTQQDHRDFVTSMTGLPEYGGGDGKKSSKHGDDDDNYCSKDDNPNDLQTIICDCDAPGVGTYPDGGYNNDVEPCEVVHLLATNGSCWTSYCNGPINGTMDVVINNDTTPSVCSGS